MILEGITSANSEQLFLFANNNTDNKNQRLANCLDKLESKFGKNVVKTGFTGNGKKDE